MSKFDEADAALASHDWSAAVPVDPDQSSVSVVHSTRMSHELTRRLMAEAARRGITPSQLVRDFVGEGLAAAEVADADVVVTVRVADLHRAIDGVVRGRAA